MEETSDRSLEEEKERTLEMSRMISKKLWSRVRLL